MPEYIYHLTTAVTAPAPSDDPADFPAQYAADKERIKNSFPNVDGPVTTTDTELQLLSGLTATAAELNQLDGVVPYHAGNFQAGVDYQAYDADIPLIAATQLEMETGAVTGLRSMSPFTVAAAIAAQGGVVKQIKVATSSPASALDATYATKETVSLTNVASGNYVVVFAIGIYTVSTQIISQKITNSSGTIKSVGESSTHAISISNASLVSIASDAAPGTGTVTYWLQAKEASNVSGTIDHAIMVAVEYTP